MSSLIVTKMSMDETVGCLLVGASMVLTAHSLSRMVFLRRSGSKYYMFPIMNGFQFINQICVFLLVTTAFGVVKLPVALWLNFINNLAYFVTKPVTMWLAYLRCSAVYPQFKKLSWLHYFLIGSRAVELFAVVVVDIAQNIMCDGSVAVGTRCESMALVWLIRDWLAPVYRFYYIICESIFYYKLFATLTEMSTGKNLELIQYRRLQTSLFTLDLALLMAMSIYRIIGIYDKTLPTYVYFEVFSSTLTIFNLTEFGLNIRRLFGTVAEGNEKTGGSTSSTSKLEMGSIHHGTQNNSRVTSSTSPLNSPSYHHHYQERDDSPIVYVAPRPETPSQRNNDKKHSASWSRPMDQQSSHIINPTAFQYEAQLATDRNGNPNNNNINGFYEEDLDAHLNGRFDINSDRQRLTHQVSVTSNGTYNGTVASPPYTTNGNTTSPPNGRTLAVPERSARRAQPNEKSSSTYNTHDY